MKKNLNSTNSDQKAPSIGFIFTPVIVLTQSGSVKNKPGKTDFKVGIPPGLSYK